MMFSAKPKPWNPYWDIATALFLGIWLPLRLVFFENFGHADIALDLFVLGVVAVRRLRGRGGLYFADAETAGGAFASRLLDLLVAAPIVSLLAIFFDEESSKWFFVFKLLYIPKVFAIRRVLDAFDSLHPVLYRLLPVGFVMPLVVHLIACGWVYLGSGNAAPSTDAVFVYGRAVHWAFTTLTTVGYGDIVPVTLVQMFYANVTMVLGVAFFGYVLSNVASLLARLDAAREEYLANLDRVEAFISYNELPNELRLKIRSYYRYLWDRRMGYDDAAVLTRLPPKLRAEVSLHMNAEMIERVPILSQADQECREEIVLQLRAHVTVPDEKIFHVGEPGDTMYFIHKGLVEIAAADGRVLATLGPGSFFGEMALLNNSPRSATAITRDFCDLYVLSRSSFEGVLSRHPAFAEHVRETAAARAGQNTARVERDKIPA